MKYKRYIWQWDGLTILLMDGQHIHYGYWDLSLRGAWYGIQNIAHSLFKGDSRA